VEDWNWETIFADYIGLYSTNATYLASKEIEIGEKRKIGAITPFRSSKVIIEKRVGEFLLVLIGLFFARYYS